MADRGGVQRLAVTAVFGAMGLAVGTWAARIPAIKDGLHLSPGILGLALLGQAAGSVLTMPAAGAILATRPPRRVVQAGLLALGGLLPVTTFATSAWQLFIVLAGWGAGLDDRGPRVFRAPPALAGSGAARAATGDPDPLTPAPLIPGPEQGRSGAAYRSGVFSFRIWV